MKARELLRLISPTVCYSGGGFTAPPWHWAGASDRGRVVNEIRRGVDVVVDSMGGSGFDEEGGLARRPEA